MSDKPPRKPTRLATPATKPKASASAGKPQHPTPKRSDLFWIALGAGCVVLAGLLFAVVYSFVPESQEETPVADVPPADTKSKSNIPKPTAADFSERAVAEWVVSQGGRVRVLEPSGTSKEIYDSASLPSGKFEIETMSLDGIDAATDDQIAKLWGLKTMRELGLSQTKVTDAGIGELQKLSSLNSLNLRGCPITDQGLQSLGKMKNLKMLFADAGQSAMSTVKSFDGPEIVVPATPGVKPFTDQGLEGLAELKGLQTLSLVSDRAGDSGLASIAKSSRKLVQLRTVGFQISDGGVVPLKNLKDLRVLELSNSLLTDRCIDTLSQIKWLEFLIVQGTRITPEGVKLLQQRLPNCKVFGGKYDPRRNSIRDILVLGGKVTLTPDGQPQQVLARFEDLPEKFTVQSIDLHEVRQLWLDDLSIPEVTDLILTASGVSPASIRRLPQLFPNLIELDLAGTAISDREATALADCKKLTHADLTRTGVTDLGGKELEQKLPGAYIFWGILRPSPDVEAGKWIVEIGGSITLQEKGKAIRFVGKPADIPNGPFRLRGIDVAFNSHMNDQEIQRLAGLRYLHILQVGGHSLTDAGVPVFETMPKLVMLTLAYPAKKGITDNAMQSLAKVRAIRLLDVSGIAITPDGLRRYGRNEAMVQFHLDDNNSGNGSVCDEAAKVISEQFPNLTYLHFGRGKLTDLGLEHIAKLTKLRNLAAFHTYEQVAKNAQVTDRGVAALTSLQELESLYISGRNITDKGLESLQQLSKLKSLNLGFTSVSDGGVKQLIEMKSLSDVALIDTLVTIRGFKRLSEARPDIKITEPSRTGWLRGMFKTKVKLTVATKSKKGIVVPTLDELPKADFLIQIVDYNDHMGELSLPYPFQTDADAIEIRLANTGFNGQALLGVSTCKGLQILDLTNTNVVDEHLKFLHGVKTLQRVNLTGTHCTAPGIAALKAALPQCEIIH